MAIHTRTSCQSAGAAIRRAALAFPCAKEDFPWGERVVKVDGRIFVFLHATRAELHVTVKLPESGDAALGLPFARPTGYNLGKSGWVSSTFSSGEDIPVDLLLEWLDESYRAVAPRRLVKCLPPRSDADDITAPPLARAAPSSSRAAGSAPRRSGDRAPDLRRKPRS